jgi:hypothetical protein
VLLLLIGAANHDERDSSGRPPRSRHSIVVPNGTWRSGYGPTSAWVRRWPGSRGGVALEEIHRRLPDYEVDHDAKVRFHSSNVTGWRSCRSGSRPGNAA